ncbi:SpoVA/SpoVAEb family sporulation membrane protein [Thermaerobacillus caldiproteolyticus]|uniref:Stage V sporulation protein AE n=1 Tax=Thermaerobacillus caldiproteolyticus TaxID=247480 RepID=A0A7V9Z3L6_9BACL|nr:SpoVA/SpoVAEb family sporulation membrane protein [Anoxybacillus caldiproteolyticus]MBA2873315.1 stage V sporulation protein AE [Anoxybacillus caldiproteolyticus]QPA29921.1 SpoVA/SpoVAEb family sporulation membrane protein [Anoxybacillus caldiproteolyticus]
MDYWMAFLIGGMICGIAQLVMDIGKFSQIHVMSGLVIAGVILGSIGAYDSLIDIAGAGALLPISGFGYLLIKGILSYKMENGWMSIGSGIFQLAGLELSFTIVLSFFIALICKPKG